MFCIYVESGWSQTESFLQLSHSSNKTVQPDITINVPVVYVYAVGRNDFDVGNIHFVGHWKGWALKIESFLGPEMATSV
jgi:hypothetical protein